MSSRRHDEEPQVGITNRDLEAERESEGSREEHARKQASNKAPIGTHEGTSMSEAATGHVRDTQAGYEGERGSERVNEVEDSLSE